MDRNHPSATHRALRALPALLLICLLGYGLRTYQLDHFGFWQDEGLTPARAGNSVLEILRNVIVVQGTVTTDTHPPLYYLLIHLLRPLLGASDFAYRVPSALLGLLLLPLLYQLGRRIHSRQLGLLAALLAAINPLQIWYGQEARMYTLAALLLAAAAYALWRGLTTPQVGRWLALYTPVRRAGALYPLHGGLSHRRPGAFLGLAPVAGGAAAHHPGGRRRRSAAGHSPGPADAAAPDHGRRNQLFFGASDDHAR